MRPLAVLVLIGLALLGGAGPAAAHNTLVSSDPPDGATLPSSPGQLTLTFDEPVNQGFNTVAVTGPNGTAWAIGEITVTGNVVTTTVSPLGPAGEYTIGYRVVSSDGHPVTGTLRFRLTQPGTGTPAPAPTAPAGSGGGGGMPVWPWVVAAAVLLAGAVVVALRLGRRSPP